MSTRKSLAERFRSWRMDREREEKEERTRKSREQQKRNEPIEKAFRILVTLGEEKLVPILKTINTVHLKKIDEGVMGRKPESALTYAIGDSIDWFLTWAGGFTDDDYRISYHWGHNIILRLWPDGNTKVYVGYEEEALNENEPLNVNKTSDIERLEDLVFNAITNDLCYWRSNG